MIKSRIIASVGAWSLVAAFAFGFLCASQAAASSFDAFYTFGDSTVDSGWWAGALNGQCGPVASPCETGNPTFDGKIASAIAAGGTGAPVGVGLMNTQVIAQALGLTSIPANQPGGTNYAISGSLSAAYGGFGNLNPNTNLPATTQQMSYYLTGHGNAADPNALYLISSGGNDVTNAQTLFSGNLTAQQNYLTSQAALLASAINALQMAGAQHIIVNGLQGSGSLPTFFTATLFVDLTNLGVNYIGADIAGLI